MFSRKRVKEQMKELNIKLLLIKISNCRKKIKNLNNFILLCNNGEPLNNKNKITPNLARQLCLDFSKNKLLERCKKYTQKAILKDTNNSKNQKGRDIIQAQSKDFK